MPLYRTLSEIPFKDLRIGMEVVSALGNPGIIIKLDAEFPRRKGAPRYDNVQMLFFAPVGPKQGGSFHMSLNSVLVRVG